MVPERVVADVIARAGRLDVLVNNAGMMQESTIGDMSLEAWQRSLAVNLTTPFLLVRVALSRLRKTQGSIANTGSIEGPSANPGHAAYCAAKAGLHGLTRAVAVDHGHKVSATVPWRQAGSDTGLNLAFGESMPDYQAFRRNIGRIHPVGSAGTPEEVTSLVAFLAADEVGVIPGQVYTVDGGRMAKLSLP